MGCFMTLSDAKKAAKEIIGSDVCCSYRNVWGFFNTPDSEIRAVFITKDTGSTEVSGVFLDKGDENGFTEYMTNRIVPEADVFGKTFFDEDPSLLVGHASDPMRPEDRIEHLLNRIAERLIERGLPAGALLMLDDIADPDHSDEAAVLLRLVILNNYLLKADQPISVEEFAYMHHELLTI